MEPSIIISIIALISSFLGGIIQLGRTIKKSDCVNCVFETRGPDEAVIQALENQNEVIMTQINSLNRFPKHENNNSS